MGGPYALFKDLSCPAPRSITSNSGALSTCFERSTATSKNFPGGITARALSRETGLANRPHLDLKTAGREMYRLLDRQRASQARTSVRSHTRCCRIQVRIATWNINGINSRLDHVIEWSETACPDVLCLQETKTPDAKFPVSKLEKEGFAYIEVHGERSYNGVAILSTREPLTAIQKGFPSDPADAPTG